MVDDDSSSTSSNASSSSSSSSSGSDGEDGRTPWKIHISRVPVKFNSETVHRILCEKLQGYIPTSDNVNKDDSQSSIVVELVYPRDDNIDEGTKDGKEGEKESGGGERGGDRNAADSNNRTSPHDLHSQSELDPNAEKEHRGFGFVTFASQQLQKAALDLQYIKGGRKVTSRRQHTMYLRPYVDDNERKMKTSANVDSGSKNICYLWSLFRCPYGSECKFDHVGEGGCVEINKDRKNGKKGKCFEYKKTGKCRRGDTCPFSHDFTPNTGVELSRNEENDPASKDKIKDGDHPDVEKKKTSPSVVQKPIDQRDCINWKTHGKCRKGEKCPYKHDPVLQQKALQKKKRKRDQQQSDSKNIEGSNENLKMKQPLSVRVFGLNYETSEDDIRNFFSECGTITNITFPRFEDSGRSKGYCGVSFASPKASMKALELDGAELHERWLRIQSGKMMREWEGIHDKSKRNGSHKRIRQEE